MSDGTLQTLDASMLEDVNNNSGLIQLDSNAKIPACSAAAVTNLSSVTKSSSDPTVSTNPSGGVGTVYQNTSSGDMFVCTTATAGANIWKNIGAPESFQLLSGNGSYALGGTVAGFSCGGLKHSPTNSYSNRIDRYAFASSSNSTDHGDLVEKGGSGTGSQSATHGYCMGGTRGDGYSGPAPGHTDMVQKFAFASGNASDTGYNLTQGGRARNHAVTNSTHAYVCGGDGNSGGQAAGGYVDDSIIKFALSADSHAVDHGNLIGYRNAGMTASGVTHGFYVGGSTGVRPYSGSLYVSTNNIQYFAYSSNTTATDAGNLTQARASAGAWTAPDYGYVVGGVYYGPTGTGNTINNSIEKYALVSGNDATDVGDLLNNSGTPSGAAEGYTGGGSTSSTTHGYYSCGGGGLPIPTMIQRLAFASDGNATDVGELGQEGGGGRAEEPYGCFD